jgi:negative regulator of sigma E activity
MNEKISALVDAELDELDERRVLGALKDDPQLCCTWERYHLIRAAMRHQLNVLAPSDMPERVRSRLEAEHEATPALRFWPLLGGFAAAAAVAVVAIFGLQTLRGPETPVAVAPVAKVAVDNTTSAVAPVSTVAVEDNAPAVADTVSASTPSPNRDDRLNAYLVGHNEFMPIGGMGNMLPYVRVVTDNPDK